MGLINVNLCPVCDSNDLELYLSIKDYSISGEDFDLIKCGNCSLLITSPQPDELSIGRYYSSEEYISHSDTNKGLVNKLYHRVRSYMLRQKFKLVISYRETGKLLDIGCGTGYFPAYMRDQGWDVMGLEPDASARAIARDKLGLEVMDMAHLESLGKAQFDVITMWHVLEHVHHPGATIDVIRDLLKPGGTFICAVPNYTSPDARHYGKYWAAYDVPRHLWHFAPNTMELLLKRHGFQLVRKKGMPFDAFYVSLLSEKYKSGNSGLISGGTKGLLTNLKATGNPDSASSVIYIAQLQ